MFVSGRNYRGSEDIEHKKIVRRFTSLDRHYRYVDDILIVFDQNKISEHTIRSSMNNLDENLEFKMSIEENRTTNCLDLSINRNAGNVDLCIYRKPNYVDITIHFFPTTHTVINSQPSITTSTE